MLEVDYLKPLSCKNRNSKRPKWPIIIIQRSYQHSTFILDLCWKQLNKKINIKLNKHFPTRSDDRDTKGVFKLISWKQADFAKTNNEKTTKRQTTVCETQHRQLKAEQNKIHHIHLQWWSSLLQKVSRSYSKLDTRRGNPIDYVDDIYQMMIMHYAITDWLLTLK